MVTAGSGAAGSVRFGSASYAGKTSNEALLSYSFGRLPCNVRSEEVLQGRLRESAAGQPARGLQAASRLRRLAVATPLLRLERGDARVDRLRVDALSLQVGPD